MSKNTDKVEVESAEAQRCKVLGDKVHVARTALSLGLHELEALKAHFAVGTIGVNVDGTNAEGRPVLSSYADFLVHEVLDRLPDLMTALQADERRWEEMSENAAQRARAEEWVERRECSTKMC